MSKVIVTPGLIASRCSTHDCITVEKHLDRPHVSFKVTGLGIFLRQLCGADFCVCLRRSRISMSQPFLQFKERQWLLGIEQLRCNRRPGAMACQTSPCVLFGNIRLATKHRNETLVYIEPPNALCSIRKEKVYEFSGLAIAGRRLLRTSSFPYCNRVTYRTIHWLCKLRLGLIDWNV